jgi:hypothetical protein
MNPFASLSVKLGLAGLFLLLAGGLLADFHHRAYVAGENHEMIVLQAQIDAQSAKNAALAAQLKAAGAKKVTAIQIDTAKQLQVIYVDRPLLQKAVAEAAHASPSFAAERRPDAFERVRRQSLSIVAAAASQSASAAAGSAASVPATGH